MSHLWLSLFSPEAAGKVAFHDRESVRSLLLGQWLTAQLIYREGSIASGWKRIRPAALGGR